VNVGVEARVKVGDVIVRVDPRYFRPTEVETLLGDPGRAKQRLDWRPRITFDELVKEMVAKDLAEARKDTLVQKHGFSVFERKE